jgi:hypothetical protein
MKMEMLQICEIPCGGPRDSDGFSDQGEFCTCAIHALSKVMAACFADDSAGDGKKVRIDGEFLRAIILNQADPDLRKYIQKVETCGTTLPLLVRTVATMIKGGIRATLKNGKRDIIVHCKISINQADSVIDKSYAFPHIKPIPRDQKIACARRVPLRHCVVTGHRKNGEKHNRHAMHGHSLSPLLGGIWCRNSWGEKHELVNVGGAGSWLYPDISGIYLIQVDEIRIRERAD